VVVIWFINNKTAFGYQNKAVGVNLRPPGSRYPHECGDPLDRPDLRRLAGLAGVGELCALQYRLIMDISPGYGYSGIVIAMLGNLHPVGVLFSSLFFSIIIVGAQTMSRMTGVPVYIAEVIQGMALMVMLIFLLFTEYRMKVVRK